MHDINIMYTCVPSFTSLSADVRYDIIIIVIIIMSSIVTIISIIIMSSIIIIGIDVSYTQTF